MRCHLILRKFDLDIGLLKKKLIGLGGVVELDIVNERLNVEIKDVKELNGLKEIESMLIEEKGKTGFKQESLRDDVLKIAGRFKDVNLKVKTYPGFRIPENAIKKKLVKLVNLNQDSENVLLIELFNDKGLFYRIFSFQEKKISMDKSRFANITVLIENPRLVDEISDFLRLCLIFGLKMKVIHGNKNEFIKMLNKAKSITKGRLSDFNVEVYHNLKEIKDCRKIGFSKNAGQDELQLKEFLKQNKGRKLLLVFGNDTYGLSQESRDDCGGMFHLTPDYEKPLKANQALAYVLGLCSSTD